MMKKILIFCIIIAASICHAETPELAMLAGMAGAVQHPICVATEVGTETSCSDGLDNDCDGDTDGADSDCASCSTIVDSDITGATVAKIGSDNTYNYAGSFSLDATKCVCAVVVPLIKVGTPNGNINLKLYSFSSNLPNALLGTAQETLTESDVTTSATEYTFTFSSCVSLAAGNYFVSIECDTLNSSTVYFGAQYNTDGSHIVARYTTAWVNVDSSAEFYRIIYE